MHHPADIDCLGALEVIDVTDPGNPVGIATYTALHEPVGVEVADDLVYVAYTTDSHGGLTIIDVASALRLEGSHEFSFP